MTSREISSTLRMVCSHGQTPLSRRGMSENSFHQYTTVWPMRIYSVQFNLYCHAAIFLQHFYRFVRKWLHALTFFLLFVRYRQTIWFHTLSSQHSSHKQTLPSHKQTVLHTVKCIFLSIYSFIQCIHNIIVWLHTSESSHRRIFTQAMALYYVFTIFYIISVY